MNNATTDKFLALDNQRVAAALKRAFCNPHVDHRQFVYFAMLPLRKNGQFNINLIELVPYCYDLCDEGLTLKFSWYQDYEMIGPDYDQPDLTSNTELMVDINNIGYKSYFYSSLCGFAIFHNDVAEKLIKIEELFIDLLKNQFNP